MQQRRIPSDELRRSTELLTDTSGYASITDDEKDPLIISSNGTSRRKSLIKTDAPPPPIPKKSERVVSLDAVRGLTIFVMNLVNNAEGSYEILEHAAWNGLTLADFVMPFFLFMVGCSIVFSHHRLKKRSTRRDILQKSFVRFLKLFALSYTISFLWMLPQIDLYSLRLPGVLQRIAMGYLVTVIIELFVPTFDMEDEGLGVNGYAPPEKGPMAAFWYRLAHGPFRMDDWLQHQGSLAKLARRFPSKEEITSSSLILVTYSLQWMCGLIILFLYLTLVFGVDVPGCGRGSLTADCNAFSHIDMTIIRDHHMYQGATCKVMEPPCQEFDPEGILSTIASVVSVIIGMYYGYVLVNMNRPRAILNHWLAPSIIFLSLGLIIHFFGGFPLNKNMYSPSFLFLMAGAAGIVLSLFYIVVDVYQIQKPFMPLIWLGSNSIILYFMDQITPRLISWFCYNGGDNNLFDLSQKLIYRIMGDK
ncbi:hypothetical protein PROFUN_02319 [Planoprotostelium fungivorum]|uniref:Heparan-alpha-glucosaminide N-acetyltransferase catalytic domain-containing protein n=1 Tax=Planoprotostelium fungivorum TaxID=1890364 RepID=A0A2P6NYL1_9EUKA|nr:hypothetical protein PROFUN_02319 [Planoprotostelium fungivorum]